MFVTPANMARSTSFRIFHIKFLKLFQNYTVTGCPAQIIPVRLLRGSRFRNDNNQEEMRYQRLLRSLSKPDIKSENAVKEIETNIQENVNVESTLHLSDAQTTHLITPEDLIKKLEEKVTPLNGIMYDIQLEKKFKRSFRVLRMLGEKLQALKVPIALGRDKLPCPIEVTIPSPVIESYRNKDEFSIGMGLDGHEKTVGFFLDTPSEYSTTFSISPKELSVVKENHVRFAEDFQNYVRLSHLPATQYFSDGGYWKSLIVRSNNIGDIMGIVVMHPQDLSQEAIQIEKARLKEYFLRVANSSYNLHSLYFQTCAHSRCTHEQSPFELLLGNPCLVEQMNNMKFNISPDSFFQTNSKAAEVMYNAILKLCRVKKTTTLLDIGCGTGPLSMLFSPRVKKCIGIDDSVQAISDARLNAVENNVQNTEFIYGRSETVIKDILEEGYHEDLLAVLNTSRTGINKYVINSLREHKNMKKIIYITTRPQSSLENFIQLCKPCGNLWSLGQAFLPILAVPVDLCPQTDQYGLIVMFQRL